MRITAVRTPLRSALVAAGTFGLLFAPNGPNSGTVPVSAPDIPAGTPDLLPTDQASRRVLLLVSGRGD